MLSVMDSNKKAIIHEIGLLSFYHPGIDFNTAHLLSADQRVILSKVVEKHYQTLSGKSGNIIG